MNFFERKGFCGEKEFIFHLGKSPQKICDVLQDDAIARWHFSTAAWWHNSLVSLSADRPNNSTQITCRGSKYVLDQRSPLYRP
jgi:hypothetical protein